MVGQIYFMVGDLRENIVIPNLFYAEKRAREKNARSARKGLRLVTLSRSVIVLCKNAHAKKPPALRPDPARDAPRKNHHAPPQSARGSQTKKRPRPIPRMMMRAHGGGGAQLRPRAWRGFSRASARSGIHPPRASAQSVKERRAPLARGSCQNMQRNLRPARS
jgi:hypothetical protein